jgi:organic hydroperoxide reductase OsmC/OhrA
MDFVPPVTLSPGPKSTYTRVRKAGATSGEYWVSEVILNPKIMFAANQDVMPSALARIHELAHEQCFIARSIKTKVTVRSP